MSLDVDKEKNPYYTALNLIVSHSLSPNLQLPIGISFISESDHMTIVPYYLPEEFINTKLN